MAIATRGSPVTTLAYHSDVNPSASACLACRTTLSAVAPPPVSPMRIRAALLLEVAGQVVVDLHTSGLEEHRDQVVAPDGEDQIHQLLDVQLWRQCRPGLVGDQRVAHELIDGAQDGPLERRPPRGVRPLPDSVDLLRT